MLIKVCFANHINDPIIIYLFLKYIKSIKRKRSNKKKEIKKRSFIYL